MPVWRVSEPYTSLWLHDEPLGYQPAVGPRISFKLAFKQYESTSGFDTNVFSVGKRWNCPWLSYVTYNPTMPDLAWSGGQIVPVQVPDVNYTVAFPGGGQQTFYTTNSVFYTTNNYINNARLTGDITNGFTLTYPDGSRDVYGFIVTNSSGAFLKALLTQRSNPQGQTTSLRYASYMPGASPVIQLQFVVDGDGRTNWIYYNSTNHYSTNLISQVTDPFGRTTYLGYNDNGDLTNITDVAGNSSSMSYDTNDWVASLTTPYGTTSFAITDTNYNHGVTNFTIDANYNSILNGRSILVTKPDGSHELYYYTEAAPGIQSLDANIPNVPNTFANTNLNHFNSFYWGPRQYAALSTTNIAAFTANDFRKARMKHWLLAGINYWVWDFLTQQQPVNTSLGSYSVSGTLGLERDPSPDSAGNIEGQKTWYDYAGKDQMQQFGFLFLADPGYACPRWVSQNQKWTVVTMPVPSIGNQIVGMQSQPSLVARLLPDGTTAYTRTDRDPWGHVIREISTYSGGTRTSLFGHDANGLDLITVTNALGVQVSSNAYNANHQVIANYNALNELTTYTYDSSNRLTSTTLPSGLVTTNIYNADNSLSQQIVVGFTTNSYTYTANDLVLTHTDPRGLKTTNTWDSLNRLTSTLYPDGSYVSNQYTALDLTGVKDRLGNWTFYGYDSMRRKIAETNALGGVTLYNYCLCGSLDSVQDAAGNFTYFYYDNQGNLTNTLYADGYSVSRSLNLLKQVISTSDSGGNSVTNTYNNQGLVVAVSNAFGRVQSTAYDVLDRATNTVDANGVSISTIYDNLNRPVARSYPDGSVENYGYTLKVSGTTSYTNQIGNAALYGYDAMNRKTKEVNVGVMTNQFAYDGAGDLLTLTDGRNLATTWHYDTFGRVTNKVDAAGVVDFVYQYDANNRLINRWTPEKGNTGYTYDNLGNLKSINYQLSTINYSYDALNRRTNMVDSMGTTVFSYDAVGEMLSAGGLWSGDTVNYSYANRLRTSLTLSTWTNNYFYDAMKRLTNITSAAGSFGYQYPGSRPSTLVSRLALPNSAFITNTYDSVARLTGTSLENSGDNVLDGYTYAYNQVGQRTNIVRNYGLMSSTASAGYDAIGELTSWTAKDANGTNRLNEKVGYTYDAAGNLKQRTNNALVQTFKVDSANALTNIARAGTLTVSGDTPAPASSVTVNGQPALNYADFTFASSNGFTLANGQNNFTNIAQNYYGTTAVTNTVSVNLPQSLTLQFDANGNLTNDGTRSLSYDTENQLTNVTVSGQWQEYFLYDGLNRRRITRQYIWQGGTWALTNETRFIYDGNVVIQERDSNNVAQAAYTRGLDLSGSQQGAGGIGGLLARTDANSSTFYHVDGNGNVTALMDANQYMVARYLYDPFGKLLGKWGSSADANVYRFSSKEYDANSGLYYYLYRFYDPNLQRWPNRDPIQEKGGLNLYVFAFNAPPNHIDLLGEVVGNFSVEFSESVRSFQYAGWTIRIQWAPPSDWPTEDACCDEGVWIQSYSIYQNGFFTGITQVGPTTDWNENNYQKNSTLWVNGAYPRGSTADISEMWDTPDTYPLFKLYLYRFRATSCFKCIKGHDAGKIYGCYDWGFTYNVNSTPDVYGGVTFGPYDPGATLAGQ